MSGIVHVITGLEAGGAERQLLLLLRAQEPARRGAVLTLVPGGRLEGEYLALGVRLETLALTRGQLKPGAVPRLRRKLKDLDTTVVLSWMYHANIAATLAAGGTGLPVAWNIRHALHEGRGEKALTRLTIHGGALLSRYAQAIVYNSSRARQQHAQIGYRDDHAIVIPNAFDLPSLPPGARSTARRHLGLSDGPVIVMLARFDPLKDFPSMRDAAALVHVARPDALWLVAGEGASAANPAFTTLFPGATVPRYIRALGHRSDVDALVAASDIAVSSSLSEALPNALGEAMAAGVPCVATDVGDSAQLVGDSGRIVPARNPAALAAALIDLLALPRAERDRLRALARERIATQYSLPGMVTSYEQLFQAMGERAQA